MTAIDTDGKGGTGTGPDEASDRLPLGRAGHLPSAEACRLAGALGERLGALGLTVATAESCTGGLVAAAITAVPGSSGWFETGLVTYSNEAKVSLLGVGRATLAAHGAVSEAVVREMAAGARARSGADAALAVSGVAGPGGGSAAKPVGTVWLGLALPDGSVEAECHRFAGDRPAVREAAVRKLLHGILSRLN